MLILTGSWRRVLLRRIVPLLAGGILGLPLGAYVLAHAPEGTLKVIISGVLVVFAAPCSWDTATVSSERG
ncbi:MAG: hypothetical protein HYY01_02230 [Chloroflexi bacterium]|nr:hypothetical protein [Chloroflexota bacterium]